MVTQYPHTITFTSGTTATYAPNGDLIPGTTTTASLPCRLEPSGGGYVTGQGGIKIDYAWIAYCVKTTAILPPGTVVTVTDADGNVLARDTVKQFSRGQLNARIWL